MALKQQATSSVPANQLTQEQIDILKSKGQYDTNAYYNPDYLATLNAGGGAREASPSGLSGQVQNVAQLPNISMPQAPSLPPAPTTDAPVIPPYPETPPAPEFAPPEMPPPPVLPPTPEVPTAPEIPGYEVAPAPEYELSPEQQAWQEMYGQQLQQWIEAGGYGIPEATQAQMIQRTTDTLKAKEAEDIRVMRNNMERRGLTNSGLVFSNEQKIRANTTTAIANSITDIQIQSALMKMASFEKALGAAGEYLGYLSEQTQLAYQPKMATWSAQQQANLMTYQGQINALMEQYNNQFQAAMASYDTERQAAFLAYSTQAQAQLAQYESQVAAQMAQYQAQVQGQQAQYAAQVQAQMAAFEAQKAMEAMVYQAQMQMKLARYAAEMEIAKMQLSQAYTTQNMQQQAYWTDWINQQSFEREKELTQMQIEANERAAQQAGKGQLWGTMLGLGLGAIF